MGKRNMQLLLWHETSIDRVRACRAKWSVLIHPTKYRLMKQPSNPSAPPSNRKKNAHFRLRSSFSSLSSSPGVDRKGAASFATRSSANSGYLILCDDEYKAHTQMNAWRKRGSWSVEVTGTRKVEGGNKTVHVDWPSPVCLCAEKRTSCQVSGHRAP